MSVPVARVFSPGALEAPDATTLGSDERAFCGVLFEVRGGPGGVLAFLFAPLARDALLAALLGDDAGVAAQAESALCEVGNIVASHALAAMGDVLGTLVLPSPPQLAASGAPQEIARLVAAVSGGGSALRIQVELQDRAGALRALLVWGVPAALA
jgi:chemotaxis protein CheY-P-specific phosphatase CheC